ARQCSEALGRAQDIVTRNRRRQAELRDLLHEGLASYVNTAGRVRLTGPPVHASADAAQALGMAFHELGTNAAKYGTFATRNFPIGKSFALMRLPGLKYSRTGNHIMACFTHCSRSATLEMPSSGGTLDTA